MLLCRRHALDHRLELVAAGILETPSLKRHRSKRSEILELPSLKRHRSKSFHRQGHTPKIRAAASIGSAPVRQLGRRGGHVTRGRSRHSAGLAVVARDGVNGEGRPAPLEFAELVFAVLTGVRAESKIETARSEIA